MKARSANGATMLAQEYYTSSSIFGTEMEAIFSKKWLCAGHHSQIPDPG